MKKESYFRVLYSLLNVTEKWRLFALVGLMLFTALIELAGIGSLFPYIKILGNENLVKTNHHLKAIYHFFNFHDVKNFLIFVGGLIFFLILLKGILAGLNNYYQSKFAARMRSRLSRFCIESYVNMPFTRVISINSATLSKHLLVEVNNVISVIKALLSMTTDIMIASALIGLMIWVDPGLIFFAIVVMVSMLGLTIKLTKRSILKIGKETEFCNRMIYRTSSEAFSALKDIKSYRVENYFVSRFMKPLNRAAKISVYYDALSNIPSIAMNVFSFGMLLIILLYLLITRGNLVSILPVIGVFAVAIQRLMPSSTRISNSIGMVRQYKPGVYIIHGTIDMLTENLKKGGEIHDDDKIIEFKHSLHLNDVSFKYPTADRVTLSHINLQIAKNSSLGIVGSSGAGKSTLVDVLLGLLTIDSGEIYCDDEKLSGSNHLALSHLVGYVPQQTFLIDASIEENIAFGIAPEKIDSKQLNKVIKISQLESLITSLPEGVRTNIGEKGVKLSGGQRQRIGIARALYNDPDILIMDEATNSLDSATEKEFNQSLKLLMQQKTLIIVAHRLSSVKFCNQLILLDHGEIVGQGTFDELSRSSKAFQELYGVKKNEELIW